MEFTKPFSDLSKKDANIAGGKGASLGEMAQSGIPVPDGFVVLSSTFDHFLKETDLAQEIDAILKTVDHKAIHTVESASEKIRGLIENTEFPEDIGREIVENFKKLGSEFVAVRSSATAEDGAEHAWAGQLDSFLNTDNTTLLNNVRRCWSSLFTPRAIFYRFEKELHGTEISVAVVIQKMVQSEISGIAFSVHPVTEDYNQIIIEAGFGLGEAIVSGSVTPDSYVVEKSPLKILDINVSTQTRSLIRANRKMVENESGEVNEWVEIPEPKASSQVLTEVEILELSKIIIGIENHYGFPCDIEWAYESGKFYIVQSRPITTLSNKKPNSKTHTQDIKIDNAQYSYYYGGGSIFLCQDLISKYYFSRGMKAEFVTFVENSKSTTFLSNQTIKKLNDIGLSHNLEKIESVHKTLISLLGSCNERTLELQKLNDVSLETCLEVFSNIGSVLELYSFFDFKYWDGAFELSKTDPEKKKLVDYIQKFKNEIRVSLGSILFEKDGYLFTLLNKISESHNIKVDDLSWCSIENISSILNNQDVSTSIENNKNLSCFIGNETSYQFHNNTTALWLWEKFNFDGKNKTVFQGKVANINKSKITGKVFLIKSYVSVEAVNKYVQEEMQEGDILVSETTNPDILLAFKKASAVITDTGGLLSHAAITSREMGITCIIDTGDASKYLNNGDTVEVDAENGVVRILNKKKEESKSKVSYKIVRSRKIYPFPGAWNYESETQDATKDLHGARIETVWLNWENGMFTAIYDEAEWNNVGKHIAKRMWDDPHYLKNIYATQKTVGGKAIKSAMEVIGLDLSKHSQLELLEHYKNLKRVWIGYDHINVPPWFIGGDFYQSMVLDILKDKYNLSATEMETIITPPIPSFSHEEEIMLYRAAKNSTNDETVSKYAKELSDKFYWIPFGYDGPTQNTKEEYEKKIKNIIENGPENITEHLKDLESFRTKIAEAHSKIIQEHSIETSDWNHIKQAHTLAEMTDERKEVTFQIHVAIFMILERLSLHLNISDSNDLRFVSIEELENFDREKLIATIKDRKSGLIHSTHNGETEVITGEAARTLRNKLLVQSQSSDLLKGKVGSRGKNPIVRGKVKVVLHPSEMDKVKEGDILVATMTTPEYVPAMRKALAILTDEGGVTCHAAIVSRELGLPAIIAIGNATQVLKDGDMVEVDADNGVVKILSKEKSSNIVEEIKKLSWFKSWEAKFPMFLVTIGAPGYFDAMKEAFGFELSHFLVITHGGILAGFWVEKELIAFGNHLSRFAEKDPEIIVKWSLRLKKETDECRALMSKGRDYFLNAEHFRELRRKDEVLSAYQVAVREVINYLPDELREKYTPDLEGARKHSETIFFELGDIVTSVLKHVAEKENLSLDLAGCMTGDELEKYFEEKLLPDSSTLQARYKCSGFINHPQFEWLKEDDIAQIEKSFVENTSDEIKGQPAYKGKVTGRAQVIKNFSAVSDFPRGDILVTGMTDPNYLPIMERAGAIVTDAGGLLCHAAIVSREMKKPCIVGTKIATHLIKTGDMVEVDADNGVVRILEKRSPLFFDGVEWYLSVTRNMSFWHQDLCNEGFFSRAKDFGIDAELECIGITIEGTRTNLFMNQENYAEYSEVVMQKISTMEGVANLKEKYKQFVKENFEALEECNKNLNVKTFEKFLDTYTCLTAGLMITGTIGRNGGDTLSAKLKGLGCKTETIPDIIATITYPEEHTPLFDSQLDLLEIGTKIQSGITSNEKEVLITEWLEKYGSIPVNYCDEPWTKEDAHNQLNSMLLKDCNQELASAEKNHKDRIDQKKTKLAEINNEEISILAYAIAEGTYLNEFRKNAFCRTSLWYRPIFQKIAEMGGSKNWRDCFFVRPKEMVEILNGKNISILDLVKQRKIVGICRTRRIDSQIMDNESVGRFMQYIKSIHGATNTNGEKIDSIKGHSANKGKVKGIVKVVLSSKDFHKVNAGDILVATMTSVDFVPIMERASAFVTNEGGITSHASIVAREMGKPCIIGTKIATQVLKDGMEVEVDADNGVVRIIK